MKPNDENLCDLVVKTYITCISESNCIPEIVNQSNGKIYLRSPKAKKDATKHLKNKVSNFLCK